MTGEKKLIVSNAGSQGVLGLVEQDLVKQLLSHHTDLVYGHKSYKVNIDIKCIPFEAALSNIIQESPEKHPILHIFWTDAETESYRSHVKDQLSGWFDRLMKYNCNNYLVIHATFQDKAAILHKFSVTKTSMSERIRNDFGTPRADRTIVFKAESNNVTSSQSWLLACTVGQLSVGKFVDYKISRVPVSRITFFSTFSRARARARVARL